MTNLSDYTEHILSPIDYFKYRINRHGIKQLLEFTTSGYPKIFALGVCYFSTHEIIICKIFDWKLRLKHEQGHANGLKHTMRHGFVMNPWGIYRGTKCER